MTSGSVAEAIRSHLEGIGEYGRPCGVKPWVVADLVDHFARRPAVEGTVFLLRVEGHPWQDVARKTGLTMRALVAIRAPFKNIASLLEASVCA